MNTISHTIHPAALATAPTAADSAVKRQAERIWRMLVEVGRRRAARELAQLAERREPFDPALAQALRAVARGQTAL